MLTTRCLGIRVLICSMWRFAMLALLCSYFALKRTVDTGAVDSPLLLARSGSFLLRIFSEKEPPRFHRLRLITLYGGVVGQEVTAKNRIVSCWEGLRGTGAPVGEHASHMCRVGRVNRLAGPAERLSNCEWSGRDTHGTGDAAVSRQR